MEGAHVGPLYLFGCSRWAREADIQGIAGGIFPVGDESCTQCREDEEGLVGEASGVPGPSSDEPANSYWDLDPAPNGAAMLDRYGAKEERDHDPRSKS
jgi:hypothetical protein